MNATKIEWTDKTWNPTRGCSRVSEGCRNCYAEQIAGRFSGDPMHPQAGTPARMKRFPFSGFVILGNGNNGPHWTGRVELIPEKLDEPLHWRKPARVFVNSMSDLFHEALPDKAIDRVFAVMALCPQHTFQVLTKRPERMLAYCQNAAGRLGDAIVRLRESRGDTKPVRPVPSLPPGATWYPLPWVWLGVSVEDKATADERIPLLLQAPAAVRFVSYEPALESVDFSDFIPGRINPHWTGRADENSASEWGIDWLIVGGESGPHARPFDLAWARSAIAQCKAAGVACFCKQLGALPVKECDGAKCGRCQRPHKVYLKDRKGGDMAEWPEDLRVREFPA